MSNPNPRRTRRRYYGRHAVKYEICFGSPGEVVESVNEHLEDGWNIHGETQFHFGKASIYGQDQVYAIQALVLWERATDRDDDDENEIDPKKMLDTMKETVKQ